eukprot:GHVU01102477.1.p1 GENE.GHVU01102477.1~~GHVU01102477.1.p1  ORF type:complete len:266 (-),score=30.84 GHVU01102477.1:94-891(-)
MDGTVASRTGKLWNKQEEEALSRSWIKISQDSIAGTNQTSEVFWGRILEDSSISREVGAVQKKWKHIQACMMRYVAAVSTARRHERSGENDVNDVLLHTRAKQAYIVRGTDNKTQTPGPPFPYDHLYPILRDAPKFASVDRISSQSVIANPPASAASASQHVTTSASTDPPASSSSSHPNTSTPAPFIRPKGISVAKRDAAANRLTDAKTSLDGIKDRYAALEKRSEENREMLQRCLHLRTLEMLGEPPSPDTKSMLGRWKREFM